MKKKYIYSIVGAFLLGTLFLSSCTDLEEVPRDKMTSEVLLADEDLVINLVAPALGQLRGFWLRESYWGMQESSSDELCFPTRGTDWFDGGVWQQQWLHTWTPEHRDVRQVWNNLNQGIASANFGLGVLGEEENVKDKIKEYRGMLKFLRSYYMYCLIDLYGISPFRGAASTEYTELPEIFNRQEAFYFIVNDMKGIVENMPERTTVGFEYGTPSRDAGYMLLAKMYLNKEVFVGEPGYDSCLIYLNKIIDPGTYQLADNYFGIFGPDNHANFLQPGDEAIFVAALDDGADYGLDNRVVWVQHTFHYNQYLNGDFSANWNGCIAPESYLNDCWFNQGETDTATDVRWVDSTIYPVHAIVCGFNYGQQYDMEGTPITIRGGARPLSFTIECPLEGAEEEQGVRVLKYYPRDNPANVSRVGNDFIIWRYADALLMKAECLARAGNLTDALDVVNEIRVKRNAPEIELADFELLDILRERGRELYWEGHRRQDMIRFGTFLLPKSNKENTSPATATLFPIPQTAIESMEGNLKQNSGY